MKRSKKLMSLLLALVLILGATYAVQQFTPESQEEEETEQTTVFTLNPESVTALSWEYSQKVSFEKQDDAWVYTEDPVFPVDERYLTAMLESIREITSSKTIENVENWDQYGLEAPDCTVTVTTDETYTLKIGQETSMGGERYFSIGDGNAYLVDSTIIDGFSYGLYDVLSCESIPDMTYLTGMEIQSDVQDYAILYQENTGLVYSDTYVWFMEGKALDSELTEALLQNIAYLSWGECVEYNAEDLSAYGLDVPTATVTAYYTENVEVATNETDEEGNTIYETQENEKIFVLEIGDATGDYRYARIAGSNMVYKIDGAIGETLMYTTYQELQPDEVLLMNWDTVDSIKIILDGETYEVSKTTQTITDEEGNETEETVYQLSGETVDMDTVTGVLDAMTSSGYANGLTPERSEEIRFIIHRDHETFPEVELAFYQYDSSSCMTTLNGAATVFVSRNAVVNLVEAVNKVVLP